MLIVFSFSSKRRKCLPRSQQAQKFSGASSLRLLTSPRHVNLIYRGPTPEQTPEQYSTVAVVSCLTPPSSLGLAQYSSVRRQSQRGRGCQAGPLLWRSAGDDRPTGAGRGPGNINIVLYCYVLLCRTVLSKLRSRVGTGCETATNTRVCFKSILTGYPGIGNADSPKSC